jgi:hypothetical protein
VHLMPFIMKLLVLYMYCDCSRKVDDVQETPTLCTLRYVHTAWLTFLPTSAGQSAYRHRQQCSSAGTRTHSSRPWRPGVQANCRPAACVLCCWHGSSTA